MPKTIVKKGVMKHKHYWHTPHLVWSTDKPNEGMVARYCICGEIQIATVKNWRKANQDSKVYPDIIVWCKKSINEIKSNILGQGEIHANRI